MWVRLLRNDCSVDNRWVLHTAVIVLWEIFTNTGNCLEPFSCPVQTFGFTVHENIMRVFDFNNLGTIQSQLVRVHDIMFVMTASFLHLVWSIFAEWDNCLFYTVVLCIYLFVQKILVTNNQSTFFNLYNLDRCEENILMELKTCWTQMYIFSSIHATCRDLI